MISIVLRDSTLESLTPSVNGPRGLTQEGEEGTSVDPCWDDLGLYLGLKAWEGSKGLRHIIWLFHLC
jgi:hypothetical protein